jgi:glycosyltransferase involved in cell wall biosynthesis
VTLPLVSVVVPALNAADWIGASLTSVVTQTYPKERLDVIVVDDGSADGTAEEAGRVLAASGLSHSVIRNSTARGPSAARNAGWQRANGEWIQFLDADDLLEPSKIDVQANIAARTRRDVAVIFSPWGHLVLDGTTWKPLTPHFDPSIGADPLLHLLQTENFMQIGSLLFSRAWLTKTGGFDESRRLIEDVDLMMRIVMSGGVLMPAHTSNPLSWYRQRAGSLSRENGEAFIEGCLRNARAAEHYWADRHELTKPRVRLLVDVYHMGARYYAEHHQQAFRSVVEDLYRVDPAFVPRSPRSLRLLTRLIGYPRAERCSVHYRSVKRALSS